MKGTPQGVKAVEAWAWLAANQVDFNTPGIKGKVLVNAARDAEGTWHGTCAYGGPAEELAWRELYEIVGSYHADCVKLVVTNGIEPDGTVTHKAYQAGEADLTTCVQRLTWITKPLALSANHLQKGDFGPARGYIVAARDRAGILQEEQIKEAIPESILAKLEQNLEEVEKLIGEKWGWYEASMENRIATGAVLARLARVETLAEGHPLRKVLPAEHADKPLRGQKTEAWHSEIDLFIASGDALTREKLVKMLTKAGQLYWDGSEDVSVLGETINLDYIDKARKTARSTEELLEEAVRLHLEDAIQEAADGVMKDLARVVELKGKVACSPAILKSTRWAYPGDGWGRLLDIIGVENQQEAYGPAKIRQNILVMPALYAALAVATSGGGVGATSLEDGIAKEVIIPLLEDDSDGVIALASSLLGQEEPRSMKEAIEQSRLILQAGREEKAQKPAGGIRI